MIQTDGQGAIIGFNFLNALICALASTALSG
jgi:hypothetical protein